MLVATKQALVVLNVFIYIGGCTNQRAVALLRLRVLARCFTLTAPDLLAIDAIAFHSQPHVLRLLRAKLSFECTRVTTNRGNVPYRLQAPATRVVSKVFCPHFRALPVGSER